MPIHNVSVDKKSVSIQAVVVRGATGKVENLGTVSYYHRNPLINWTVNRWIKFKDWKRKGK